MRSKVARRILEEMRQDPWYIRLRRWVRRKIYVWILINKYKTNSAWKTLNK